MALIINKDLETLDGEIVPAGLYVKFTTTFPPDGSRVVFGLHIWRNKDAHDSGKMQMLNPPRFLVNGFQKELTQNDYDSLTPSTVHQFLKDIIEALPEIHEDVSPQVEFVTISI